MIEEIKILLNEAVLKAKEAQKWDVFDMPEIDVTHAKNEQFGDYSSNVAMVLAKKVGKNPMDVAEQIVEMLNGQILENAKNPSPALPLKKGESKISPFEKGGLRGIFMFEKVETAAPGYINFYLSTEYLKSILEKISVEKENFGNSEKGKGIKVNNEFISANPTGPLHLGNGRGGFYGDCLSKVLRKAGFEVSSEYYVNDAGIQVERLGHSVLKDEEAAYSGEYIDELNKKYSSISNVREIGEKAAEEILENIVKKTISEKMQIVFDEWASEKKIQEEGYIDRAIGTLKDKNLAYESEGALWLKTTEFGDDKDRVLVKANGEKTYFASDCGYILNKMERRFDKIIEIWGADHHGYVARFGAAAKALGFSGDVRFLIAQLVRLVKDGKEVKMSKRAGNVVYIDDLIEEVGHDVTRFFFLMYSPDTHMNFDLGLAKERSQKNPVYYVQYAHARICSILAKAADPHLSGVPGILSLKGEEGKAEIILSLLTHEKELSLIKELNKFPELVEEISESYEVHKLPHYAIKLADKFHSFYDACRVIDEENPELSKARLVLSDAVRMVLSETLNLIGVSAPEKM